MDIEHEFARQGILELMYPPHVRRTAVALLDSGFTYLAVSRRLGISRCTLREWHQHRELIEKYTDSDLCPRCKPIPQIPTPPATYSYLLGLYLGDGCISPTGDGANQVWRLRVYCTDTWPGLLQECAAAIQSIRPDHRVGTVPHTGCTEVYADWKHWPCVFPQHGPGMKHSRPIILEEWQCEVVDEHPYELLRGLIHSDGCRVTNRVRRKVAGEWKYYEYPRYFFSNTSPHILGIMGDALDLLDVRWQFRWRKPGKATYQPSGVISVAERSSVAFLDSFIGPKS